MLRNVGLGEQNQYAHINFIAVHAKRLTPFAGLLHHMAGSNV